MLFILPWDLLLHPSSKLHCLWRTADTSWVLVIFLLFPKCLNITYLFLYFYRLSGLQVFCAFFVPLTLFSKIVANLCLFIHLSFAYSLLALGSEDTSCHLMHFPFYCRAWSPVSAHCMCIRPGLFWKLVSSIREHSFVTQIGGKCTSPSLPSALSQEPLHLQVHLYAMTWFM